MAADNGSLEEIRRQTQSGIRLQFGLHSDADVSGLSTLPGVARADRSMRDRSELALERDARVIVMRPSPILTRDGWRSHCDERFDPFWARVNEAGITVVAHAADSGYSSQGYARDGFETHPFLWGEIFVSAHKIGLTETGDAQLRPHSGTQANTE